ncbi:MAG: hypothetical protein AMJ42_06165 [Deltaproteobacteria bacterium DG_8]|nr:MAG: hypothetical protein AMJ42_06165 [Deltaproteobacteria bacterium DG_8]
MNSDKEFISLSEAAKLANVSSMTIRRFAKKLQVSNNPDDAYSVKVLSDKNPYGKKCGFLGLMAGILYIGFYHPRSGGSGGWFFKFVS